MRLWSWAGAVSVLGAGGIGYFACEIVHRADPLPCAPIVLADGSGELSEPPAQALATPRPLEEIDLSCTQTQWYTHTSQSIEPPLADAAAQPAPIRLAGYAVPASSPDDCEFKIMPFLTDDSPPAKLPSLIDVPVIVPIPVTPPEEKPNPNDPLFQQVKAYFEIGTIGPVKDPMELKRQITRHDENLNRISSDWRHFSLNNPTAENQTPLRQKPDTTEVRSGDLPPKSGADGY